MKRLSPRRAAALHFGQTGKSNENLQSYESSESEIAMQDERRKIRMSQKLNAISRRLLKDANRKKNELKSYKENILKRQIDQL